VSGLCPGSVLSHGLRISCIVSLIVHEGTELVRICVEVNGVNNRCGIGRTI